MTLAGPELFTRSEALAGLPVRRAHAALFLIESRTAHLVARARQALEPFLGEITAAERDLAFIEAFALGKAPPLRPTIQDLECHAATWRDLAPDNPRGRAVLAHLLGQKYQFAAATVPGIRAVLGLDEPAVAAAYEKLYGQPLAMIYTDRRGLVERLRWAWAGLGRWFENLPPFWSVFALTLTETVGASILALPIALAGIGPIPGVGLLILLGLVNMLTIAAEAEAAARSGEIRYGAAFLGRMVEAYLGRIGASILSVGLVALCSTLLLAYYTGFATALADITRLPAALWAAGLFLVVLYFLRRESLNATITSAMMIGAVNLGLLLIIALLALAHSRPENLGYINVPLLNGRPFDVGILQLIFGVVLAAYFGHLSVGNCARLVLHRDPSARSLIRGAAAAQVTAILIYSIWVLAVNGAVAPAVLARQTGTALAPLAAVIGPVKLFSSVYVILGVAMVSVHFSLALYNLVRERLPRQSEPAVRLPRRQGRLILRSRSGKAATVISLTYLGLTTDAASPQPRFRVDIQQGESLQHIEIAQTGRWDETMLRSKWPHIDRRVRLTLTTQEATPDGVRLQISTPLAVRYEGKWDTAGLHMTDLLELPAATRQLLTWLLRRSTATAAETAAHTGQDIATTRLMLAELVEQGLLVEQPATAPEVDAPDDGPNYRPQLAFRRNRGLRGDFWQALVDDLEPDKSGAPAGGSKSLTGRCSPQTLTPTPLLARLGARGRFWIAASPAVIVFLIAETLLWTGNASFPGPLSFIGVVVVSLLAGLFPVLLLISSRRKGDFVPATVYRTLGQPWLLGGIYLLFMASIFLHGLVIWQDPIQRACALLAGLLMIAATGVMIRQNAFAGRVIVEICEDLTTAAVGAKSGKGGARFAITALGRPAEAKVEVEVEVKVEVEAEVETGAQSAPGVYTLMAAAGVLPELRDLRQVTFDLPAGAARDLKIWAHRVTPEGISESLPAVVEVRNGDTTRAADLRLTGGQVVLALTGPRCRITLRFDSAEGS